MKSPLTSSVVIMGAMGLAPDGVPAETPGVCALCGLPIAAGDMCAPLSLGSGFMDDLSMAARGSDKICGYCGPLLSADNLRKTGYGAFSAAGVQPFRKWIDVATMLTNPPEPPFVLVYATANNQHMAWRAPVNLSRDLFYVRVGLRDLKIRRKTLLGAVEACRVLGHALALKQRTEFVARKLFPRGHAESQNLAKILKASASSLGDPQECCATAFAPIWMSRPIEFSVKAIDFMKQTLEVGGYNPAPEGIKELQKFKDELMSPAESTLKTLPNPFVEMSPNLKDAAHGMLKQKIFDPGFMAQFIDEINSIMLLTAGEVWALRFILTPNAGNAASVAE